ncbi:MAG: ABC transporter ATP-binding protein [Candidatus Delongbacteria bacterium]|nr:ABC transporter ATP-binding protein [Candidatus Delongbacteria bacterium]MBN2834376.1 ABC transporter ATP-binding protein [Candidatus Delongbacteria bacterium]
MSSTKICVNVKNLSKRIGKFELKDISIEIPYGYVMGIAGRNGSGKTTLINHVLNLLTQDSGIITVFDKEYPNNEVEIKDKIGFVFEEFHYLQNLSVDKMKNLIAPFYKSWNDKYFYEQINKFNIDKTSKLKKLSKGQKQIFSLIIALSHDTNLLVLDEPFSGVDAKSKASLIQILKDYTSNEQRSIIFCSHNSEELESLCDLITILQNGEVFSTGTVDELLDSYVILSGSKDNIDEDLRSKIINYSENSFGFKGIVKTEDSSQFTNIKSERVTIKDILEIV